MSDERSAMVRDLCAPLAAGKGWMKFIGIVFIVMGVFEALTIVGIVFAWLPIWLGVLLLQSATAVERAHMAGDEVSFRMSLDKLRTYFVIQGVLMIISIGLFVLSLFLFGAGIVAAVSSGAFH